MMIRAHSVSLFAGDRHGADLNEVEMEFGVRPTPPREPRPKGFGSIDFECSVPFTGGDFSKLVAAIPPRPMALTLTQPYSVRFWTSRSGRALFGCVELGERFWTASATQLERRRIQSRLDAYNRTHAPRKTTITGNFTKATEPQRRRGRTEMDVTFEER